jgi:hypothetical protein
VIAVEHLSVENVAQAQEDFLVGYHWSAAGHTTHHFFGTPGVKNELGLIKKGRITAGC